MDNRKIGKLIAKLRKQQGLTQQDLGDKVGVGFRAVSNWERGNTLPDIGNMNELSKILGITLDELMSGELKEVKEPKDKKKLSKKSKLIISIITIIVAFSAIISTIIIYNNNRTYVYKLASKNENEYIVEGQVTFHKNQISIIVNKLYFNDQDFTSRIINDYEYQIMSQDTMLFGFGVGPDVNFDQATTIQEIANNLRINYIGNSDTTRKEILKNNVFIKFTFWDNDDQIIKKTIEMELLNSKIKNTTIK